MFASGTGPEDGWCEVLDAVNLRRYETNSVGRTYARSEGLQAPEAVLLDRLRGAIAGARILDLGVGAGRTTPHLLAISDDYVGVDYSSRMVELCRSRFPQTRFEVHDARDLRAFGDGEFGFVMFAFNGIDCLEHDDRLRAFREIHRVLAVGGWFVFSSHNRDTPSSGFRFPAIDQAHHPLRRAARAAAWVPAAGRAMWNRVRLRRYEVDTPSYAIRNDSAHEHALLTYYIRCADQRAQLRTVGFTAEVTTFALDGRELRPDMPCDDAWIYYCVQKETSDT